MNICRMCNKLSLQTLKVTKLMKTNSVTLQKNLLACCKVKAIKQILIFLQLKRNGRLIFNTFKILRWVEIWLLIKNLILHSYRHRLISGQSQEIIFLHSCNLVVMRKNTIIYWSAEFVRNVNLSLCMINQNKTNNLVLVSTKIKTSFLH